MRDKKTGEEHGIVRTEENNGWISEGTYKKGKVHGLKRWISSDEVWITVAKDYQRLARISFNKDFELTFYDDPLGLLIDFTPD